MTASGSCAGSASRSGSFAPNKAATRFFGLMFGDMPRGDAGAFDSQAASAPDALGS